MNDEVGVAEARAFLRALGRELHGARRRKGWTRKDLQAALDDDVSLQTLATYEHGTRQCSVFRFVQIAAALGEDADEILRRVLAEMHHHPAQALTVELRRMAEISLPALGPLRRWAEAQLDSGGPSHVHLTADALEHMAELCQTSVTDIVRALSRTGDLA